VSYSTEFQKYNVVSKAV